MILPIIMISIGGLIGYLTNKIAVKMLFRPIKPKRILFFTFQGVLPKRKTTIAESMGRTIENAFVSKDDIFDALLSEDNKAHFKTILKQKLTTKIKNIVPPMFQSMLGDNMDTMINKFIDKEGDKIIEDLFKEIKDKGFETLDITALVKEKVDALDFIEFEQLVLSIVKKELRHIELVGLFLGMFIGAMQYGVITLF